MNTLVILATIFLFHPIRANASEEYGDIKGCGRYKVAGIIRKADKSIIQIVINEKTGSEYRFIPKAGELNRFVGFIDVPVSFDVLITKLDGTRGEMSNPQNMALIAPNPLNPTLSSGFKLLDKKVCVGKK